MTAAILRPCSTRRSPAPMSRVSRRAGRSRKRRADGAASASRASSRSPGASRARVPPSLFPAPASSCWRSASRRAGRGTVRYRRLAADYLGIPAEIIEVAHGDSDDEVPSAAAVASRSTMSVGGAVAAALDAVIEKGKRLAAHVLEAAEADIQYRGGVFEIAGTDRNIALLELAERAKQLGDSLDAKSSFDAAPSFPNGVHVAEVEIDPATGRTTLAAYTCVDDCGRVLQPVLVEGKVQGGVAQGIGQALLEWGHYDDSSGQLLAGSFMDYAMPRADDLPDIVSLLHPVRCTTNQLGVKGVGEAGTTASLAAVMNAVADAGANIDMPATPERVWRALSANAGGT